MLEIISHRGLWTSKNQMNSIQSFTEALEHGFGVETDIRDFGSEVVISHDLPDTNSIKLSDFFEIYTSGNFKGNLALNIKSNGLAPKLKKLIETYDIKNYFFFDMSIPDHIQYLENNLYTYSRISEYENNTLLNNKSNGIWLDSFSINPYKEEYFYELVSKYGSVCVVSDELHGRSHIPLWEKIQSFSDIIKSNLQICTDFPIEAQGFFK